jgi:hypothetical protein
MAARQRASIVFRHNGNTICTAAVLPGITKPAGVSNIVCDRLGVPRGSAVGVYVDAPAVSPQQASGPAHGGGHAASSSFDALLDLMDVLQSVVLPGSAADVLAAFENSPVGQLLGVGTLQLDVCPPTCASVMTPQQLRRGSCGEGGSQPAAVTNAPAAVELISGALSSDEEQQDEEGEEQQDEEGEEQEQPASTDWCGFQTEVGGCMQYVRTDAAMQVCTHARMPACTA